MNKETYLNILNNLLDDFPWQEKNDALEYIAEYFDEACSEQEVVKDLGTPQEYAASLRESLGSSLPPQIPQPKQEQETETTTMPDAKEGTGSVSAASHSSAGDSIQDEQAFSAFTPGSGSYAKDENGQAYSLWEVLHSLYLKDKSDQMEKGDSLSCIRFAAWQILAAVLVLFIPLTMLFISVRACLAALSNAVVYGMMLIFDGMFYFLGVALLFAGVSVLLCAVSLWLCRYRLKAAVRVLENRMEITQSCL